MSEPLVIADSLVKVYRRGTEEIRAVDGVSLALFAGEFVTCIGASGSGKSTLLNLLGGLDVPTSGTVRLDQRSFSDLDDDELSKVRRDHIGFVFQFFNLLPTMNAWENVAITRLLDGARLSASRPRALELLERVGLDHRAEHRPAELSGGELQRVAIARALMADPVLVLADEPTGNLDERTGREILELLGSCAADGGRAVFVATHDRQAVIASDRRIAISDGKLVDGESHS